MNDELIDKISEMVANEGAELFERVYKKTKELSDEIDADLKMHVGLQMIASLTSAYITFATAHMPNCTLEEGIDYLQKKYDVYLNGFIKLWMDGVLQKFKEKVTQDYRNDLN